MSLPRKVVDQVIERDGGFCLLALPCCLGEANIADHRANRQSGGSAVLNHASNLIAACSLCNGAKADAHSITLMDLEERGLYVRHAATNALTLARSIQTPVMDLAGDRWFLISATKRVRVEDFMREVSRG